MILVWWPEQLRISKGSGWTGRSSYACETFPPNWNHRGQASNDHSDLSRQGRVPLNWQTSDRLSNLPYTRKLFSLEENSIWQGCAWPQRNNQSAVLKGEPQEAAWLDHSPRRVTHPEPGGHPLLYAGRQQGPSTRHSDWASNRADRSHTHTHTHTHSWIYSQMWKNRETGSAWYPKGTFKSNNTGLPLAAHW